MMRINSAFFLCAALCSSSITAAERLHAGGTARHLLHAQMSVSPAGKPKTVPGVNSTTNNGPVQVRRIVNEQYKQQFKQQYKQEFKP
jgi:hypothetical protein